MKIFICLMTPPGRATLVCYWTRQLEKAVAVFEKIPKALLPGETIPEKNALVYLEIWDNEPEAKARFEQITKLSKSEKERLIKSVNPGWVPMAPGVNVDVS